MIMMFVEILMIVWLLFISYYVVYRILIDVVFC